VGDVEASFVLKLRSDSHQHGRISTDDSQLIVINVELVQKREQWFELQVVAKNLKWSG
jgi:hypothetical protein